MEKQVCEKCKYFNGICENRNLTRVGKKKRRNGYPCEYWEERTKQPEENDKTLKAKLLDIAIQLETIAFALKDEEN